MEGGGGDTHMAKLGRVELGSLEGGGGDAHMAKLGKVELGQNLIVFSYIS